MDGGTPEKDEPMHCPMDSETPFLMLYDPAAAFIPGDMHAELFMLVVWP